MRLNPHLSWALPLALVGCSLSTIDPRPCADSADCRDAFGYGHACADDGFCAVYDLPQRCDLFPADTVYPIDPATQIAYASLFNHSSPTQIARVHAARLAVIQANANGGLEGRTFVIIECTLEESDRFDTLSQREAASQLADELAHQIGVPAIVGPSSSGDVEAAYNAIANLRTTVLISPSATSPALTDLDGLNASDERPGMLWRTAAPDTAQAAVIANDLTLRGVSSVAVVHQTGPYGDALTQLFSDQFDGAITLLPFSDAQGRDAATQSAGEAGVDEVLFISSEVDDVVSFLVSANAQAAYDPLGIFLTDAAATVQLLDEAATAQALFPRVRGTRPSIPSGNLYDTFVANYAAEFAGEDAANISFTAHAYDASWMVIYGAAWAAHQGDLSDGEHYARGLRMLSEGPSTEVRATSWNTVKASFAGGSPINIVGTSGQLDYNPLTEETRSAIDVWTIHADGSGIVVDYISE